MNYGKIKISGYIESLSGMHIGGMDRFSAIGSIDSFVVRDVLTNRPMIPGSSLKGKLRYLLDKRYVTSESLATTDPLKYIENEDDRLLRLFGSTKKGRMVGRLIFSDCFVTEQCVNDLKQKDVMLTEVKAENAINRLTAVANPRFIERSVRGAIYEMNIIYTVPKDIPEDEIVEDFKLIREAFDLLESDYLGGSGSRGYGKVKFNDLAASVAVGEISEEMISKCNEALTLQ